MVVAEVHPLAIDLDVARGTNEGLLLVVIFACLYMRMYFGNTMGPMTHS